MRRCLRGSQRSTVCHWSLPNDLQEFINRRRGSVQHLSPNTLIIVTDLSMTTNQEADALRALAETVAPIVAQARLDIVSRWSDVYGMNGWKLVDFSISVVSTIQCQIKVLTLIIYCRKVASLTIMVCSLISMSLGNILSPLSMIRYLSGGWTWAPRSRFFGSHHGVLWKCCTSWPDTFPLLSWPPHWFVRIPLHSSTRSSLTCCKVQTDPKLSQDACTIIYYPVAGKLWPLTLSPNLGKWLIVFVWQGYMLFQFVRLKVRSLVHVFPYSDQVVVYNSQWY
jgi:hypothetical protein